MLFMLVGSSLSVLLANANCQLSAQHDYDNLAELVDKGWAGLKSDGNSKHLIGEEETLKIIDQQSEGLKDGVEQWRTYRALDDQRMLRFNLMLIENGTVIAEPMGNDTDEEVTNRLTQSRNVTHPQPNCVSLAGLKCTWTEPKANECRLLNGTVLSVCLLTLDPDLVQPKVIDRSKTRIKLKVNNRNIQDCRLVAGSKLVQLKLESANYLEGELRLDKDANMTLDCGNLVQPQLLSLKYSELVTHNLSEVKSKIRLLKVSFASFLPLQLIGAPFCLLDKYTKVDAYIDDRGRVVCNLTDVDHDTSHEVLVVRSDELLEATIRHQKPIHLNWSGNLRLMMTRSGPFHALKSEIKVEVVLDQVPNADGSLIRFGVRTLFNNNSHCDRWSRVATTRFFTTILATARKHPYEGCGVRTGYQVMAKACGRKGNCVSVVGDTFEVHPLMDPEKAALELLRSIDDKNDVFRTLDIIDAIANEKCNASFNVSLMNNLAQQLLQFIQKSKDTIEVLDGLRYLNVIMDSLSPDSIQQVIKLYSQVRPSLMMLSSSNKRSKRNTDLVNALAAGTGSVITEDMADTLLRAYDLLVSKNQQMEVLYLNNIDDLLSGFCIQTDSTRAMKASGGKYTDIKLQGLVPSYKGFLDDSYSMAGTTGNTVMFDSFFVDTYDEWKCSNGTVTCSEICMGTAETKQTVLQDNQYMKATFSTGSVALQSLTSDLYKVAFLDPITGKAVQLANSVHYTVRIPLADYKPVNYYKCFVFDEEWDGDVCYSAEYATRTDNNVYQLECTCSNTGFIAVFITTAPTPVNYSPYREVCMTFIMSPSVDCELGQATEFVKRLADQANILTSRFVNVTSCKSGMFNVTLRPAFQLNQTTNSYAIQAINRVIHAPNGFGSVNGSTVVNMIDHVVSRNMSNDGNARRISLRIDKNMKQTVGNDSKTMTKVWLSSMATSMRISEFRFKNPTVEHGTLFNFTVTLPFSVEASEEKNLSAEEITLWIQEQIAFNEFTLVGKNNDQLKPDTLLDSDIYRLVVASRLNTLMVTLASVVAVVCTLGALCIGGLVVIKLKTDKLIEFHNREVETTARPTEARSLNGARPGVRGANGATKENGTRP